MCARRHVAKEALLSGVVTSIWGQRGRGHVRLPGLASLQPSLLFLYLRGHPKRRQRMGSRVKALRAQKRDKTRSEKGGVGSLRSRDRGRGQGQTVRRSGRQSRGRTRPGSKRSGQEMVGPGTREEQHHGAVGNEHVLARTGGQMAPQPLWHCLPLPTLPLPQRAEFQYTKPKWT